MEKLEPVEYIKHTCKIFPTGKIVEYFTIKPKKYPKHVDPSWYGGASK